MAKRASKAQPKAPRPRKPRKPPAPTPPPVPEPSRNGHARPVEWEGSGQPIGRVASDIRPRSPTWFVEPWIPRGTLSMVVGLPACGKSTFLAWLVSQASRCIILPGSEEEVDVMLLPRLLANGVNLDNVLIVDQQRIRLHGDREKVKDAIWSWGADLLVVDPIDDYLDDDFRENDPAMVRTLLKSAHWIAAQTACAVVAARHPGKSQDNVMVGGRQWRAVPKAILEVLIDAGPPERRMIRSYKDSHGQQIAPHLFTLEGGRGEPKRFVLQGAVSKAAAENAKLATDARERMKGKEARALVRQLLGQGEQESVWVLAQCRANGCSESTTYEAKNRLGVDSRREGFGRESKCFWTPPRVWPEEAPEAPAGAPPGAPGGVAG